MRPTADPTRPCRARPTVRRRVWQPAKPRPAAPVRPLDALGRARVEAFAPLAYRLAWQYARHHARDVPPDELIAEALYGLTYAAGLFDEGRQVPFGAYATLVVRHRLIQAILSWRRGKRVGPYPTRSDAGDDTAWEAEDRQPAPDLAAGAAARELCDRIRRVLPASWYAVIRLYYAEGFTYAEIGRRVGLTRESIRQMVTKATERVRQKFPEWPGA